MNTMKKILLVLSVVCMAAGTARAVDYSRMSNDELNTHRGTMYNATPEEWNNFHTEWWKRLSQMGPDERQKYMGPRGWHQGYGRGHGMGRGMMGPRGGGYCCPCPGGGPSWQYQGGGDTAPPAGK